MNDSNSNDTNGLEKRNHSYPDPTQKGLRGLSVHEVRKHSRHTVAEILNHLMELDEACLQKICDDKAAPTIEVSCAKAFMLARLTGNFEDLNKILDRVIGKVPQRVENEFIAPNGKAAEIPDLIVESVYLNKPPEVIDITPKE